MSRWASKSGSLFDGNGRRAYGKRASRRVQSILVESVRDVSGRSSERAPVNNIIIWDDWQNQIPANPLAADVFADGVYRMPREEALRLAHIEFNTGAQIRWLNFDIDQPDSYDALDRSNLPAPNIFVSNRSNGHGHALYALDGFIGLTDASRMAPIRLAADIQRGMTRRLGADPRYQNRLAKNPLSARWASSFMAPSPYHLTDLLAALDRADIRRPPDRIDTTGLGRNCDLFDIVRVWAYAKMRTAKATMSPDQWREAVFSEVAIHNLGYAQPLSVAETRGIAKSIATWTWKRFNREAFSDIQASRRLKGAASQQRKTRSLIEAVVDHNPDMAAVLPVSWEPGRIGAVAHAPDMVGVLPVSRRQA